MNKRIVFGFVLTLAVLVNPGQAVGVSAPSTGVVPAVARDEARAPAAPLAAGNVIYATSCSQANVQAAIDKASDGDIVLVPPGHCTWTTPGVNKPSVTLYQKGITLLGAGAGQTVITDGTTTNWNETPLRVDGKEGRPFRITGFTFVGHGLEDWFGIVGINGDCKEWRVDHCKFEVSGNKITAVPVDGYTRGVVDHCLFKNSRVTVFDGYGHDAWKRPLGLGTADAVYIEDNTFVRDVFGNSIDANHGGRYVFRYNQVTNSYCEAHSLQNAFSDGTFARATRSYEIYHNHFTTLDNGANNWMPVFLRGGTGVVFSNRAFNISGSGYQGVGVVDNVRSFQTRPYVLGKCDGDNPLDRNTSPKETYRGYPCLDQIGRSTDHGAGDDRHPQALEPLYAWDNTLDGQVGTITVHNGPEVERHIQEGRDFFNAPKPGYTPYTYPHPLTQDLALTTTAGSGAARLDWEVVTAFSFPTSTTWRIEYAARGGPPVVAATGLVSPTRAYTVAGLSANTPHTVTLSGMLDVPWGDPIAWANATTVVTPTGLTLHGRPGDTTIHLDWVVTPSPSVTTTWRVDYYSQTVTLSEVITASVARTHTLIGLTNYQWYTVTLHAMLGETFWLSDTVRVMPTDKFVYLPLVLRGYQ